MNIIERIQSLFSQNIDSNSSVYDLYDDSIKMFQVMNILNEEFRTELGIIDLVTCNNIGDLIEKIQSQQNRDMKIIGEKPLSLIQESYWLGREQEFYGGKNSTHLYLEIKHKMNEILIEQVIRKLIRRHEALRSIIKEEKEFIFHEEISDKFNLEHVNISLEEKESYFKRQRHRSQVDIRNLDMWPLFTIKNICIDNSEQILLIDIEMIIIDGMSLQILAKEFIDEYEGKVVDKNIIKYLDCANLPKDYKGQEKYKRDYNFWNKKIENMPAAPKLPESKNYLENNIYNRLQQKIKNDEWNKLENIAKKFGVTVSIILLYAYLLTIERWSENDDFTINVTISNRPYEIKNVEKTVGNFTSNVLIDFSKLDKSDFFENSLKNIRNKLYQYYEHNSYEGVQVIRDMVRMGKVEQQKSVPIVFTSMLFGTLPKISSADIVYCQSQTSQVSLDNQIYKIQDGGVIVWDYLDKIYPNNVIKQMFSYYCSIIKTIIKTSDVTEFKADFEKDIFKYNETIKQRNYVPFKMAIKESLDKFHNSLAISDLTGNMTYGELEEAICGTANKLKLNGVTKGKYVVVKTDKSRESVIVIISILFLGAAYVPVEKSWPKDRINYIMKTIRTSLVIDPYEVFSYQKDIKGLYEDMSHTDIEDTAYVIFTSGSTGYPKGVEISYKSMMNTILDINERIQLNSNCTVLGLSSFCFDLSVYDIFATLISGGHLKLINELRDTESIREVVDTSTNMVWNSVPAAVELFIESLPGEYKNNEIKQILLSGDWININLPKKIKKYFPKANIYSLGGATEASIWSICYKIKKVYSNWASIPYGYPLTNQRIYVLDEKQGICPTEVVGEIYIGGYGVAKGYINDVEKTENSFIDTQYGRLYKTGDFGKFSYRGYVIFCGRKDFQIKIGGYRIELGEIESQINSMPGIDECVAVVNDKKQIIVFYRGITIEEFKLKKHIKDVLPTYMYPYKYNKVDDFPLNINGKIDRNLLKEIANVKITEGSVKGKVVIEDKLLNKVMGIWNEILNCSRISPENDFFELGGDSIKAQRIVRKIEEVFKIKVPFISIIESKNIFDFAEYLSIQYLNLEKKQDVKFVNTDKKIKEEIKFPLTKIQLAYINGKNDNFQLGKYNAHYYFEVDTKYTTKEIENAVNIEINRHDALRTVFMKSGFQIILYNIPKYYVNVIKCKNEQEKEEVILQRREVLSHKNYNYKEWPLFTFEIIESDVSRTLLVSLSLLVCDGDSMQIFFNELSNTLKGISLKKMPRYTYRQYVSSLNQLEDNKKYEEDKMYWLEKLNSFSSYPQIPMLTDLDKCKKYTIERKSAVIDEITWRTIKEISRKNKISPSSLLCTIYGIVLSKWSNQNDIMINLTVFERKNFNEEVENIIGDFTKLLPLEMIIKTNNFWKLATQVQSQIIKDLDHLSFDGTEVIREVSKKRGLFGKAVLPVVFTCILFDKTDNFFEGLGKVRYVISQTPQVFLDNQIIEMDEKLYISWDIVRELFDDKLISEIFSEFVNNIKNIGKYEDIRICSDFVNEKWDRYHMLKNNPIRGKFSQSIQEVINKYSNEEYKIFVLNYRKELCPPEVIGDVYISLNNFNNISNELRSNDMEFINHPSLGNLIDIKARGILKNENIIEILEEFVPTNKLLNKEEIILVPNDREQSDEEKEIVNIYKKVFGIEQINNSDDFYSLGGDSIILMKLVDEINKRLKSNINVDDILKSENIHELAKNI